MASPEPANMIARRVTDDLIAFNGETAPRWYMKFFQTQKIHKTMPDQDEVHDSLLAAKDAKRSDQSVSFGPVVMVLVCLVVLNLSNVFVFKLVFIVRIDVDAFSFFVSDDIK
ncbi:hypothetical protein Tco_1544063 [Tanacetum coccineum]